MGRMLQALGLVTVAFLAFVGLLHGVLAMRGRNTPEALGAFHDWPVIGGFFPKHVPKEAPPTPAERRELNATAWLADSRNEFRLPAPFTVGEIEDLVRELKDAKSQADAVRARFETEQAGLDHLRKELEGNREALNATAEVLEAKSRELGASRDELDRYRTFVQREEIRNLKTLSEMYGAMAPEDAAQKLGVLDDDVVAKVISRMSERKAGKVLAAMETPRAVAITKRLQALLPDAEPETTASR